MLYIWLHTQTYMPSMGSRLKYDATLQLHSIQFGEIHAHLLFIKRPLKCDNFVIFTKLWQEIHGDYFFNGIASGHWTMSAVWI